MTENRLNEIERLINMQIVKLSQIKAIFEIALGGNFLDYSKVTVYNYISLMDDRLEEVYCLSNSILKALR
jgi:hypothetical protein